MIALLREARKRCSMTLAQVAQCTGLSVSFLSDLERGRADPSLQTLEKLARCYGVTVSRLLDGATTTRQPHAFQESDIVRNINPNSLHYGNVGAFKRYWSEMYTFAHGRGCDVYYPGVRDPYGRPETAQSVADLEMVPVSK